MNHQEKKKRALWTALAACITIFHLIPFYILLTTALKAKGDFSSKWKFPDEISLGNFAEAWDKAGLAGSFFNTAAITLASAALLIVIGSLAAIPSPGAEQSSIKPYTSCLSAL
jgi:raffinose/stachyose/melibiose transport system permease protein